MIGIFVALLSGALMSIQGVFNTEVTRQSSVWVSASWVQFSALITCLVIWGIFDRKNLMLITRVSPVYMLLGGVMGAFITWTVIKSMDGRDTADEKTCALSFQHESLKHTPVVHSQHVSRMAPGEVMFIHRVLL